MCSCTVVGLCCSAPFMPLCAGCSLPFIIVCVSRRHYICVAFCGFIDSRCLLCWVSISLHGIHDDTMRDVYINRPVLSKQVNRTFHAHLYSSIHSWYGKPSVRCSIKRIWQFLTHRSILHLSALACFEAQTSFPTHQPALHMSTVPSLQCSKLPVQRGPIHTSRPSLSPPCRSPPTPSTLPHPLLP